MKKFLSVLLFAVMVVAATAQTSTKVSRDEVSKLSIAVKAGLTYDLVLPQGDFVESLGTLLPGISLDYTFNPIFGMGADLSFLNYKRSIDQGKTMDATVYSAVNLSNLFAPVRTGFWKKVNFYGNLGGGLGWYSYTTNAGASNDAVSPLMLYGVLAEYSINRKFAVGLEGQYRYYMDFKENPGVAPINGLGVDGAVAAVSLRYKFGSKDKMHTRDMSMSDFYPSPVKLLADEIRAENAELMRELDALKADNDKVRKSLDKLSDDVTSVKAQMEETKQAAAKLAAAQNSKDFDLPEVLFEFQTNKLTNESQAIVNNVVSVLKNNVFNSVVLSGHADNIGSDEYNQGLGLRRANAVKEILTSNGIPATKIETVSFGETQPVAPNNTPEGRQLNRRVEFDVKR